MNYLAYVTQALNIKIFNVFGLWDFLLIFNLNKYKDFLLFFSLAVSLLFLTCIQYFYGGSDISLISLYFPLKLLFIGLYFNTMGNLGRGGLKIILFVMMIPLFVSSLAYAYEEFNNYVIILWGIEPSPTWRFGGVYGDDVNTLGMYSTLALISLVVAYQYRVLKIHEAVFFISLPLFNMATSGMRAGIIALFAALLLNSLFKINIIRLLKAAILISLFAVAAQQIFNLIGDEELAYRFSLDSLLHDFDIDSGGNLAHAINYFSSLIPRELTLFNMVFGYDSSIIFVDGLYMSIAIQYGFFGILILLILVVKICLKIVLMQDAEKNLARFLLIFSLIVSIKGIFPVGAYYIFWMIFILNLSNAKLNNKIS